MIDCDDESANTKEDLNHNVINDNDTFGTFSKQISNEY